MHIRKAGIMTIAFAGLMACGGTSYGTGPAGGGTGGGPVGSVDVGSGIQFVSGHNGSMNPAVDTVAVGSTVTWTWRGGLPHNVRSTGSPGFASSSILTGSGTYAVTFTVPGTYRYDCAVHGQAMTGTIVVQ
jgi:plastocyanin